MHRILVILLLATFLLPAPHPGKPSDVQAGPILVSAKPLPLSLDESDVPDAHPLRFLHAWSLTSSNPAFGGFSALHVTDSGQIIALNDSGILAGFQVEHAETVPRSFLAPLPIAEKDKDRQWWEWDSESLAFDPITKRYWVGFELQQKICRYSPGFARVEACRVWPEIEAWPTTGSLESLAMLPDGRFLAISEMGMTRHGDHDTLLFSGDPADSQTDRPIHLRYVPPRGFRPTDMVAIDSHRLLVLNRRITVQELFTATISLVELPDNLTEGTALRSKTLIRLAPPLLADNFEGIALSHEGTQKIVWIISDDNHEFFQRTLLLKFALD